MTPADLARALQGARFPILSDVVAVSWSNWREATKEVFVVLFFSLMPLWLGLVIVMISATTWDITNFLGRFASSSDLGILAASLLGPLLYMMFRDEDKPTGDKFVRFPSGLWLVLIMIACCIVATAIYSLTYLSETVVLRDNQGAVIELVNSRRVAAVSWVLFSVAIVVTLIACAIRNSLENQAPRMMSADTQSYVDQLAAQVGPVQEKRA